MHAKQHDIFTRDWELNPLVEPQSFRLRAVMRRVRALESVLAHIATMAGILTYLYLYLYVDGLAS